MKIFTIIVLLTTVLTSHVISATGTIESNVGRYGYGAQRPPSHLNNAQQYQPLVTNQKRFPPNSALPKRQQYQPQADQKTHARGPNRRHHEQPSEEINNSPSPSGLISSLLPKSPSHNLSRMPSQQRTAATFNGAQVENEAPLTQLRDNSVAPNPLAASLTETLFASPMIATVLGVIPPSMLPVVRNAVITTINNGIQAVKPTIEALLRILDRIQTYINESIDRYRARSTDGSNGFVTAIENAKFKIGTRINDAIDRVKPKLETVLLGMTMMGA